MSKISSLLHSPSPWTFLRLFNTKQKVDGINGNMATIKHVLVLSIFGLEDINELSVRTQTHGWSVHVTDMDLQKYVISFLFFSRESIMPYNT